MSKKLKILIAAPLVVISLLVLIVVGYVAYGIAFRTHPDPIFNIGNNFSQPVTVYFDGQKMGKVNSGESKIFYPNGVVPSPWTHQLLITSNPNSGQIQKEITTGDLLVELKSNSGMVLYSKQYTWDELDAVLRSVTGRPYWIGSEK